MGLLRDRHSNEPAPAHYVMRERLLSVGDDSYIEDGDGQRVYWVDGKALRARDTLIFKELDGTERLKIQERAVRVRDTMEIEDPSGNNVATIKKALVSPLRDRFSISVSGGADLEAKGNVLDHEYTIKRDGNVVAEISKKWVRVRDTYSVQITAGEDIILMLALTAAIDSMVDRKD